MKRHLATPLVALLVATGCTAGGRERVPTAASKYPRGGTLHVASEHYTYDPQVAYAQADWEVMRCCLLRTLFTYSGTTTEDGGAVLRPDLATDMGMVSPDGLTWTFTLKPGIRYGPPFQDTEITSADIARALEREGRLAQGYSFYYSIIEGFDALQKGKVGSISGVTVPDDRTLVVRLTGPSGDLPYLFAMPATAPIPDGATDGHSKDYERFLVSSGPYMFEGSSDLDFSLPPSEQAPVSGYRPGPGSATLVRNPSWDPSIDAIRGAYVERFELELHQGSDAAGRAARATQVERNGVDLLLDDFGLSINPEDARRYRADPSLVGGLLTGQQNAMGIFEMDVAMPPFDDVNVRRAVLYAIDRRAVVAGAGIAFAGVADLPEHLAPDSLEGGLLTSYDPYSEHGGNLEAAKGAMAASKYDHDGDGVCDDSACRNLPAGAVLRNQPRSEDESYSVRDDLRQIGIDLDIRLLESDASLGEQLRAGRIAMTVEVSDAWYADFVNGSQLFVPLYASASIPPACCNLMLVGASADQLRALGHDPVRVPSVDDRIEECQAAIGADQAGCWARLDQYMMEEVVPAVPIMIPGIQTPFSTRVLHASIDQWTAVPALDQVALKPGFA